MSRRDQIQLTPDEVRALLDEQKIATIASIGRNGRPHVVPLWFVPHEDGGIATWTYAKSQKVANLDRLPQATVLVESGQSYEELRGVTMECDVEVVRDIEEIARIGTAMLERYTPDPDVATAATQFVRLQAEKRVGLVFRPTSTVSWDHSKLGGTY
ncbi:PPOX class probable F420-dependent enzyme [Herbihabitans rhizosphaerae]|uniref:PPOX class probable F420-dependent enzyme n=1 Tax=Herbihabitans rhizosphaerae TaxID=1872711 RepID=A0A4Q7KNJ4_9PSEU|nr:pyridoxamine 5'-phosphate oxidase family protein [Herbihabitans rhizosphaerae]RZS37896.1 PPOX class probable F420-dependent enzyme [Herbihabitans rhizosphaerae]